MGKKTFHAYLIEYAARHPDRKLLGGFNRWLSVTQVLSLTESVGSELARLGICRGDLVALRTYRTMESVLIILGLQAIGAVVVLTDHRFRVSDFLNSCSVPIPVKFVISDEWGNGLELNHVRTAARAALRPFNLPTRHLPLQPIDSKAPGFLIFTSGSTGRSKAVVLNQYGLENNLLDAYPLGDYQDGDIALGVLPLDHVFGLVLLAGICVLGYGIYLPEATDIPSVLAAVQNEGITRMNGVPSLYLAMANQKTGYDISSLRAGFIGGGPCTQEQFLKIERELDMTLIPAYGMSECVGITSASSLDPQEKRANSIGKFYARNTGKILLEDGSEAPVGAEGEICVDGHARMVGYYGDDAPQEELLHTGDLGYVDEDGYVHISGRKKDIIIRNGLNLSVRKIETALLSIVGVEDAAVVGLSDKIAGEVPAAMVVCTENALIDLLDALGSRLNKNEMPLFVHRVGSLPRTAAGKPDKQKIREMLNSWKV